ncbi:MAG: phosphatidylserine decarboxylase [Syntrophus sp. PtaB.Bin001]|nr:MAG: phosphatidylserine decarboxylase [Syntrophus sp. PtaB.Bin001]
MENILIGLVLSMLLLVPLAIKWELPLKPVVIAGAAVGLLSGVVLDLVAFHLSLGILQRTILLSAMIVFSSGTLLLIRFFRDPERITPEAKDCVICPADGVVKYIKPIENNSVPLSSKGFEQVQLSADLLRVVPEGKGYLVGIGMSFLDVHVTRAPISGRFTFCEHVTGSFLSLKRPEAVYRNERLNQVIENDDYGIALIHIASRLVRRIITWFGEGGQIVSGQRIGRITFGSQVDLILPQIENLVLKIEVGQKVVAGETVIAEFKAHR